MNQHERRARRTRSKIFGTAERPRLSVFKSNAHVYAQLINDEKGITIAAVSDSTLPGGQKKTTLTQRAGKVGALIAEKAKEKKVTHIVFDRGRFVYTGVIKSLAEGARKGGLAF